MPPPLPNAAFVYLPENFTAGERLVGRQAASEAFLKAFVRHSGLDKFYCYTVEQKNFEAFGRQVATFAGATRGAAWVKPTALKSLADPGTLFRPGPDLGSLAWLRRHFDQRAFSLCGITHTTADDLAIDALGGLATSPVQAWDALVCTSRSVKTMVERLLGAWEEYLARSFGAVMRPVRALQLPIIPLGVDCDALAPGADAERLRRDWRARLKIGDDDFAVLYLGRLTHTTKANPLPLYLGLEKARAKTGKTIHLIQAGWFPSPLYEKTFREGAAAFAPSVQHVFLDGRTPEVRGAIWRAADIFASFPDSVQETFGLTPLEAMAAGVPVVASDWDGYRETVRDGTDGILVPTSMPEAGAGLEAAYWFASGIMDYEAYAAAAAQSIAVDTDAAAEAFVRLIEDAALRARMGEAGAKRARDVFDWRAIVPQYQALWSALAESRKSAPERAAVRPNAPTHPLRADPFLTFAEYPAQTIGDATLVETTGGDLAQRLKTMRASPLAHLLPQFLLTDDELRPLLEDLASGPQSAGDLKAGLPANRHAHFARTLGWLAKTGLVRILAAKT